MSIDETVYVLHNIYVDQFTKKKKKIFERQSKSNYTKKPEKANLCMTETHLVVSKITGGKEKEREVQYIKER